MSDPASQTAPATRPSETVRTVVSLLLFIHLFVVGTALSSGFSFSRLQGRLVDLFRPYTAGLHFDPNVLPISRRLAALPPRPWHLVNGDGDYRLHQWLVSAPGGNTYRFPEEAGLWSKREDRYALLGAYFARLEADEVPAEMARALCLHLQSEGEAAEGPFYVRCIRHLGASAPASVVETDVAVELLYEADVWFSASEPAQIQVLKRNPPQQSAPARRTTNESSAGGPS